jgi:tight adherence protein C
MVDDQVMFVLCVAGAVAAAAFWVVRVMMGTTDTRLRERLASRRRDGAATAASGRRAADLFQRLGTAAARPFMPETRAKVSEMRKRLARAGIYSPAAIKLVTGMKVICLVAGLGGGYVVGAAFDGVMLGIPLGGLVGYAAPAVWLNLQVRKQQLALEYGLPDALDLMVVCVEAGLGIDAAMQRVGMELAMAHPRLSKEFEITDMETRIGLARSEALRNLGVRTGSAPLQGLAAMLIQAERFGTSVAGALRIHGESLRTQRQYKAEEMAARASVKMSFPLVLFIFPATFIVLAGPTVIGLMNSAFFKD